ncbi:hypothetical protein BDL97_02G068000 [Sphagnum fallax]|nr:hypothetical protein BDL97_02G068000 [Sphagnum fallax]
MMGLHYPGHALFSGLRRSCTAVVACTGFFELSATVAGRILQDTGINSGQCNKANNVNEQESLKENLPSELDSQEEQSNIVVKEVTPVDEDSAAAPVNITSSHLQIRWRCGTFVCLTRS